MVENLFRLEGFNIAWYGVRLAKIVKLVGMAPEIMDRFIEENKIR